MMCHVLICLQEVFGQQPGVDIYKYKVWQHMDSVWFQFQGSEAIKKDKPTAKNTVSHKSTSRGISAMSRAHASIIN